LNWNRPEGLIRENMYNFVSQILMTLLCQNESVEHVHYSKIVRY